MPHLSGMITATRDGATMDFTELTWSLLPANKCGWVRVPPAPPTEVAEVAAKAASAKANKPQPKI